MFHFFGSKKKEQKSEILKNGQALGGETENRAEPERLKPQEATEIGARQDSQEVAKTGAQHDAQEPVEAGARQDSKEAAKAGAQHDAQEPVEAGAKQNPSDGNAADAGRTAMAAAWPVIPPLNRIQMNGADAPEKAPELPEERKAEIGPIGLHTGIQPDDLRALSLEELLFVTAVFVLKRTRKEKKNAEPAAEIVTEEEKEQIEEDGRTLHNELLARVRNARTIYCLFEKTTGYPLLDGGFVEIYLSEDHAAHGAALYTAQYRSTEVREFTDVNAFFNRLYYLGMERVMVDNGYYKGFLQRGEMTAPPDALLEEGQSIAAAPALCFAMTDFLQEIHWPVKYEKRDEIVKQKSDRMMACTAASNFILPVDVEMAEGKTKSPESAGAAAAESGTQSAEGAGAAPAENGTQSAEGAGAAPAEGNLQKVRNGMRLRAPLLTVGRKVPAEKGSTETKIVQEKFVPLYTDFDEYRKNLKPKESFRPLQTNLRQAAVFLQNADGIIINPEGQKILVRKDRIAAVLAPKPKK